MTKQEKTEAQRAKWREAKRNARNKRLTHKILSVAEESAKEANLARKTAKKALNAAYGKFGKNGTPKLAPLTPPKGFALGAGIPIQDEITVANKKADKDLKEQDKHKPTESCLCPKHQIERLTTDTIDALLMLRQEVCLNDTPTLTTVGSNVRRATWNMQTISMLIGQIIEQQKQKCNPES